MNPTTSWDWEGKGPGQSLAAACNGFKCHHPITREWTVVTRARDCRITFFPRFSRGFPWLFWQAKQIYVNRQLGGTGWSGLGCTKNRINRADTRLCYWWTNPVIILYSQFVNGWNYKIITTDARGGPLGQSPWSSNCSHHNTPVICHVRRWY